MSPNGKAYLEKLYQHLNKMPEEERVDAVREIESHIEDGLANGQLEKVILARLGDPRKLAKAYRSEYIMEQTGVKRSIGDWFTLIGFYCTTGLLSVMVIPVLATIAYGFGLCTILILIGGVVRSFGVTWINMTIGPGMEVPTEWSMPFALVVGAIIGTIAYFSWKYLKLYLGFLSVHYKKTLPGNRN